MKLKQLGLVAHRLMDEGGSLYLRLLTAGKWIWYKPFEDGFELVSDEKADELEAAFNRMSEKLQ